MYLKQIAFAAILAVVAAQPDDSNVVKRDIYSTPFITAPIVRSYDPRIVSPIVHPLAHSTLAAPLAYRSYGAPLAYSAGYSNPLVYPSGFRVGW